MAVTWDTIIDVSFGPTGNFDRYPSYGWSDPGWTEGTDAGIELGPLPHYREYFVCIEATPYQHQTFAIYANGQLLGVHLAHWSFKIAFPIQDQMRPMDQRLRIDFQLPSPKRPCDHGNSEDRHWRGLQVSRVSVIGLNYDSNFEWLKSVPQHESELNDGAVLSCFESLGDNCEFGFAQKRNGVLGSSLLKFSATPVESLLFGLEGGFIGLASESDMSDHIVTSTDNGEYMIKIKDLNIDYHTLVETSECDDARLIQSESRKITARLKNFLDSLHMGSRVFVVKRNFDLQLGDVWALWIALQRYGNNTLLWVKCGKRGDVVDAVEVMRPGLLSGTIAGFAPYDRATAGDDLSWISICRKAYRFWTSIELENKEIGCASNGG